MPSLASPAPQQCLTATRTSPPAVPEHRGPPPPPPAREPNKSQAAPVPVSTQASVGKELLLRAFSSSERHEDAPRPTASRLSSGFAHYPRLDPAPVHGSHSDPLPMTPAPAPLAATHRDEFSVSPLPQAIATPFHASPTLQHRPGYSPEPQPYPSSGHSFAPHHQQHFQAFVTNSQTNVQASHIDNRQNHVNLHYYQPAAQAVHYIQQPAAPVQTVRYDVSQPVPRSGSNYKVKFGKNHKLKFGRKTGTGKRFIKFK